MTESDYPPPYPRPHVLFSSKTPAAWLLPPSGSPVAGTGPTIRLTILQKDRNWYKQIYGSVQQGSFCQRIRLPFRRLAVYHGHQNSG